MSKPKLELISLEDINAKSVEWLWYPYIPLGKITIIQGDPGGGKTTLILRLSSLLSRGKPLPFENQDISKEPIKIIYQTAEDGYDDTIKPRLLDADADCSQIKFINEADIPLTMLDERIEEAIIKLNAKLFILDPIQAYLGANIDMNRANEIQPLMKNLANIASRQNCAIVLVGHMNKIRGNKSIYRGIGTIDIPAAARSVLIVGELKSNPDIRAVVHDKSSLAPKGDAFAFKLSKEKGFQWIGKYDINSDELLAGYHKESEKSRATQFILEQLSSGPVASVEIFKQAKINNICERTLNRAKAELNVRSKKIGTSWCWILND